jgi:hypothetical protein
VNKKPAVLILKILKKYKKIRAYKLRALLMLKGIEASYYYNYIRRFEKEGILSRKRKMVGQVPHVYVYLNPDVDVDEIIKSITDDRMYTNYETFKRHLLSFTETHKTFRNTELESAIRQSLHKDMTAYTMSSMIKRAVKEGLIWKMGIPKSYDGIHSTLYATSDHKLIKEKIPTIKNLYEKMIVKFVIAKDGSVTWPDLKEFAFQKYGSTIPKFRKAFNNLLSKKYLIYDGKIYTLNNGWDYQKGFEYMPRYARKGERQQFKSFPLL